MVMEVVEEEDTGMSCSEHPFKNHSPGGGGGICAFCLQDKLGKLVSSSFPSSIFPPSSASASSSLSSPPPPRKQPPSSSSSSFHNNNNCTKTNTGNNGLSNAGDGNSIVFRRSRSTVTVNNRNRGGGFWSFLALNRARAFPVVGSGQFRQGSLRERRRDYNNNDDVDDNDGDEGIECFSRDQDDERKVSRSRSVGCGSRSFSGDFFERISTGFGDCTLRRIESHREGKDKTMKTKNTPVHAASAGGDRVRCGGIFGGFSSSSSSSSSTTNWGAPTAVNPQSARGHWRSRSWGWALASPMRVFSKPKRKASANVTPNLNAIPSILAVGG